MNDNVLKARATTEAINVLVNDKIHASENFDHSTEFEASGDSGVIVHVVNPGQNGPSWFYWFNDLEGTSTLTTDDTGATSQVIYEGFEFDEVVLQQSCGDQPNSKVLAIARWTGGTVTISNAFGVTKLTDIYFLGGVDINYTSPHFGEGTGIFRSAPEVYFEMALPMFDRTEESQTVNGDGLLKFTQGPKLTITNNPPKGSATVVDGKVVYAPQPTTDGEDSFDYQVMTQLGDKDNATVAIGTMDLDIHRPWGGSELSEVVEDNPGLFLRVNDNDDNGNLASDLNDTGFVDNDLAKLVIKEKAPAGMDPLSGYFTLSFDPNIRVWHSNNKTKPDRRDNAQVISASDSSTPTRFRINDPETDPAEDFVLWVEGVSWGITTIAMTWQGTGGNAVYDSVTVNVVGLDYDIDSDNDNGYDFPENDSWEEYLEDSEFGIGKLIYPNNLGNVPRTPTRLRLPTSLDSTSLESLRIRFSHNGSEGGQVQMFTTPTGPNQLNFQIDYALTDLNYDPLTGGITVWLNGIAAASADKHLEVFGRESPPANSITADLKATGTVVTRDSVRYMVVEKESYYPTLVWGSPYRDMWNQSRRKGREIRNLVASDFVYGGPTDLDRPKSAPQFGMKVLNEEEVRALIGGSLNPFQLNLVISVLFPKPLDIDNPHPTDFGLKVGIYWDHVASSDGVYTIAFAGTESHNFKDWITNLRNLTDEGENQYRQSILTTNLLKNRVPAFNSIMTTGHSLGGGLAAASSLGSGALSHTFNASGFPDHTLKDVDGSWLFPEIPANIAQARNLIDNFNVWTMSTYITGIPGSTAKPADCPDILTLLQVHLTLMNSAYGDDVWIEGVEDLTKPESIAVMGAIHLAEAISGNGGASHWVQIVDALWNALHTTSGFSKLAQSHKFPSIYYGLLHEYVESGDPVGVGKKQGGWDVYYP